MKINIKYLRWLKDICKLVDTNFAEDMNYKLLPHSKPYTQKEAKEMARLLGNIYMIAHRIYCKACENK